MVLDTNVLMHCRLFDEMPWHDVFGADQVRLIIPLAVLDELDQKAYSGNKRLAKRAGKVLARLTPYLDEIERDGIAAIPTVGANHITTLEILGEDEQHQRPENIDLEILRRAQFLAALTAKDVVVVTADRGMRVRGKARGIRVITLDESYRLPSDEDDIDKQGH